MTNIQKYFEQVQIISSRLFSCLFLPFTQKRTIYCNKKICVYLMKLPNIISNRVVTFTQSLVGQIMRGTLIYKGKCFLGSDFSIACQLGVKVHFHWGYSCLMSLYPTLVSNPTRLRYLSGCN